MVKLPIVSKTNKVSAGMGLTERGVKLPLFYMADFSVMGLWVSDYSRAVLILRERYPIIERNQYHELLLDDSHRIFEVVEALKSASIDSGFGDIVDQVYQG